MSIKNAVIVRKMSSGGRKFSSIKKLVLLNNVIVEGANVLIKKLPARKRGCSGGDKVSIDLLPLKW